MNEEMIFIPANPVIQNSCILTRKIAAIRLDGKINQNDGKAKLGAVLQLPAGSNLELCGNGFNPRTVKVRHQNSYYFVFQDDLAI